jgi:methylated-DNA-[protein]-cysteine S-methyltransferase
LKQWKISTDLGSLYLTASSLGLRSVSFEEVESASYLKDLNGPLPEAKILAQAEWELREYLEGRRQSFSVPLDLEGTVFQRNVWQELQKIPYGQTRSYAEVAVGVKNPNAVRAVGNANGKNPMCIIIPCHRVIASDGTIGGYSGGLEFKRRLLEIETSMLARR